MRESLAAVAIGAIAVACCGLLPIMIGAIGGATLAILLGGGAGIVLTLILLAAVIWRRHRRSCAVEPAGEGESKT